MRTVLSSLLGVALIVITASSAHAEIQTVRVSVSSSGEQATDASSYPSISADGTKVAFTSSAANLVPGDTNGRIDVFVHNLKTGRTRRVSVSSSGEQANQDSYTYPIPSISADGTKVAFGSRAHNLVAGDTNRSSDIFVHNLRTGRTRRVSVSSSGGQANHSRGGSQSPSISDNGTKVAFTSEASNLVPGDTNGEDVFVHNLKTGKTRRVASGWGRPSISGNGNKVAFTSSAPNLAAHDTNNAPDVFVHNLRTGRTRRVSVSSSGEPAKRGSAYPSISGDGAKVVFISNAHNLVAGDTNRSVDVFVHNLRTRRTRRVSVSSSGKQANGIYSYAPSISADGTKVAFTSDATNLVADDTNGSWDDVFVHGLRTGRTRRVSLSSSGEGANNYSNGGSISTDGTKVAFYSEASNLVADDTNGYADIFVHGSMP